MKKEYFSPLFEEVVLMTEDVLTMSDMEDDDNMKSGNEYPDSSYHTETPGFNF